MFLNVGAHNVSIQNIEVSKSEYHITCSITKHTASQNVKCMYISVTKRFVTVYVL